LFLHISGSCPEQPISWHIPLSSFIKWLQQCAQLPSAGGGKLSRSQRHEGHHPVFAVMWSNPPLFSCPTHHFIYDTAGHAIRPWPSPATRPPRGALWT
jgi:Rieske Fe-S protein